VPLDPDVVRLLAQLPAFDVNRTPAQARAEGEARRQPGLGDQSVRTRDFAIPGRAGAIAARLYTPAGLAAPAGLLVYYHGGGFVLGGLDSHDAICRDLAAKGGVVLAAIDYRLAPEHPFPAAVEDAWDALTWIAAHADELGSHSGRLGVGGDSAGGCLAAVVALCARDAGLELRLQLLVYPVTDFSEHRPSMSDNGEGYFLSSAAMRWFEQHYQPVATDWRASPLLAPDHRGTAAAVVLTCEFDPLRDEGNEYATRLAAAGVTVEHHCYPGLIHGSLGFTAAVPAALALMDDAAAALQRWLARP